MSLSKEGLDRTTENFKKINKFVNDILQKNNILLNNIVQMNHYGHTYLLGVKINENITEEEILNIIKLTSKENYDKHIDFFGKWPCDIPYYKYYEDTMKVSIKKMIETMLYFGLVIEKENVEFMIREFSCFKDKKDCDTLIEQFPKEHPIRICYQEVANINFSEVQLTSFVKMAMWQIKEKLPNWNFVDSKEAVTKLAEEINKMNVYTLEQFIKENKNILVQEPNKYNYLFMIFYKYYSFICSQTLKDYKSEILFKHLNDENEDLDFIFNNDIKNLIMQIELIENYKFDVIFDDDDIDDVLDEKLKCIQKLYEELIEKIDRKHNYELEEKYARKHINFLEEYLKQYNVSKVKNYLSSAYNRYACVLWDLKGTVNDESDQCAYKAIELNTELINENPERKIDYYIRIAINYCNMAIEYYKAYQSEKIKNKDKYIDLLKKSIFYREELTKLEEFTDIQLKIKNYYELGRMYFFINEIEKGKENFSKVTEMCKENENLSFWIENINDFLNDINS